MPEFYINNAQLKPQVNRLEIAKNILMLQAMVLTGIESMLSSEQLGSGSGEIKKALLQLADTIKDMENEAGELAEGLTKIRELYGKTENGIITTKGEKGKISFLDFSVSAFSGSAAGNIFNGSYDLFTFKATGKVDNSLSIKNGKLKDAYIEAGAGLEGHLAHGKVGGKYGVLSGNAEVTAGHGEAGITGKASLYKDGKLDPTLSLDASAKAEGIKGSADALLGSDEYNIHAEAEGTVGEAEAHAGISFGKVKSKGAGKSNYGFSAEAGAEATGLKGKVSGGVTICGVKLDASITGKAFSVGGTAGVKATSTSASGKLGISALLGGEVEFSIDWSGLKFPWDN